MKCEDCGIDFPDHLVHVMHVGEKRDNATPVGLLCPICALKKRNLIHNLPADTPFSGEQAEALRQEALEFVRKLNGS